MKLELPPEAAKEIANKIAIAEIIKAVGIASMLIIFALNATGASTKIQNWLSSLFN